MDNNKQLQLQLLDAGILISLYKLMSEVDVRSVQKECYWAIRYEYYTTLKVMHLILFSTKITKKKKKNNSNIVAGTESQIQAVIDARMLPMIINAAWKMEVEIKREAAWAIANIAAGGNCKQIHQMVLDGCFAPLVEFLSGGDTKLIEVALAAISNILACGERIAAVRSTTNDYKIVLYENDAVSIIEELQHHHSHEIFEKSQAIIKDFYSEFVVNNSPEQFSHRNEFNMIPCEQPVIEIY